MSSSGEPFRLFQAEDWFGLRNTVDSMLGCAANNRKRSHKLFASVMPYDYTETTSFISFPGNYVSYDMNIYL